jgi:hypothetical protein
MRIIEEFGSLKDNPAKIKALLHRKAYIFPFKDGNVRANRLTLLHGALIAPQPQRHKPYSNNIFPAVLHDTIFKTSRAIRYKLKDRLFSSIKGKEHEPEVPPSLISFLGTTVGLF